MKKIALMLGLYGAGTLSGVLAVMGISNSTVKSPASSAPSSIEVHFSPKGGCTDALSGFIGKAQRKVRLQAYSFTSKPIAAALVNAAQHADVKVILDRSVAGSDIIAVLKAGGVGVRIDRKHSIAHNKVVLIDDQDLETGSYNFTQQAERSNAENCLFLYKSEVFGAYASNWDKHWAHAEVD